MVKAVFFDLEGVLLKNTRRATEQKIAQLVGGTPADLREVWTRYRRSLLTGRLKAHQFGQLLDERFRLELGHGQQIWRACYQEGLVFDPIVLRIAEQLRAQGCMTGILSNLMHESLAVITHRPEIHPFAPRLFSCETHLIKPELVTYQFAAECVRCDPDEIILVDDLPINVGAARKAGWSATTFVTDETDLSAELERLHQQQSR